MRLLIISLSLLTCVGAAYAIVPDAIEQDPHEANHPTVGNDTTYGAHGKGYAMDDHGATEINSHSAKMLFLEGEQAWRSGDPDTALNKVKKSLEINYDDMDAHLLYANIMDEKVHNQTDKDPELFNRCVEEWLSIMRNRFGEEKNMRLLGINPFGDLYHDEEWSILAKRALVKLTGFSPGTFETDKHYLKRVLRPSTQNISGSIVGTKKKVPTQ